MAVDVLLRLGLDTSQLAQAHAQVRSFVKDVNASLTQISTPKVSPKSPSGQSSQVKQSTEQLKDLEDAFRTVGLSSAQTQQVIAGLHGEGLPKLTKSTRTARQEVKALSDEQKKAIAESKLQATQLQQEQGFIDRLTRARLTEIVALERAERFHKSGRQDLERQQQQQAASATRTQEQIRFQIASNDTLRRTIDLNKVNTEVENRVNTVRAAGTPTLNRLNDELSAVNRQQALLNVALFRQAIGWVVVYSAIRAGLNVLANTAKLMFNIDAAVASVSGRTVTLGSAFAHLADNAQFLIAELSRPITGGGVAEFINNTAEGLRQLEDILRSRRIEQLRDRLEEVRNTATLSQRSFEEERQLRQRQARGETLSSREQGRLNVLTDIRGRSGGAAGEVRDIENELKTLQIPLRETVEQARKFRIELETVGDVARAVGAPLTQQLQLQLNVLQKQEDQLLAQGKSLESIREQRTKITRDLEIAQRQEAAQQFDILANFRLRAAETVGIDAVRISQLKLQLELQRQQEFKYQDQNKVLERQLEIVQEIAQQRVEIVIEPLREGLTDIFRSIFEGKQIGAEMATRFVEVVIISPLLERISQAIFPSQQQIAIQGNTDATTQNTQAINELTNQIRAGTGPGGGGGGLSPAQVGRLPAGGLPQGSGGLFQPLGGGSKVAVNQVEAAALRKAGLGANLSGGGGATGALAGAAGPAAAVAASAFALSQLPRTGPGGRAGGAAQGALAAAPAALAALAIPVIGPIVAGAILIGGAIFGARRRRDTVEVQESKDTIKITSRLDITNKELRVVNRNLVALKQSFEGFVLPESFFFSARRGTTIQDQVLIASQMGLQS